MFLKDAKTAVEIISEVAENIESRYSCDIVKYLTDFITKREKEVDDELRIENTITFKEAPTTEEFKNIVYDILHERIIELTPHGRYGGDIFGIFYWNDRVWKCTYSPFWNRYNKEFYYIDYDGDRLYVEYITED